MVIKKIYYINYILYLILLINSFIYTSIISLILFHNLLLIKVVIIKCLVVFLHKHRIFHNLGSSILSAYITYKNWFISVGDESLDSANDKDKNKDEEMSTAAAVACGIFTAIIVVGIGVSILQQFYPDAIPAIKNALYSVGTTLIAILPKLELGVGGGASEATAAANAEASEATAAANAEASEAAAAANAEASEATAAANAEASEATAAANAEVSNAEAPEETTLAKTEKFEASRVTKRFKKLKKKLKKKFKSSKTSMEDSSEESTLSKNENSEDFKVAKTTKMKKTKKTSSKFFKSINESNEEKERKILESAHIVIKTVTDIGKTVENPSDVYNGGVYAARAQKLAIESDIEPEAYLRVIRLLFHHNVPASDCTEIKDLFDTLSKIKSLPDNSTLYPENSLKEIDRYFYIIANITWDKLNKQK